MGKAAREEEIAFDEEMTKRGKTEKKLQDVRLHAP